MGLRDVAAELRTTEALTEGLILFLVLFTFVTFSLTLIPVPPVLGVDPNTPVVQFTIPVVLSFLVWVGVVARRAGRT
jgi:uncharacterized RDD family membrane protein YckC